MYMVANSLLDKCKGLHRAVGTDSTFGLAVQNCNSVPYALVHCA